MVIPIKNIGVYPSGNGKRTARGEIELAASGTRHREIARPTIKYFRLSDNACRVDQRTVRCAVIRVYCCVGGNGIRSLAKMPYPLKPACGIENPFGV